MCIVVVTNISIMMDDGRACLTSTSHRTNTYHSTLMGDGRICNSPSKTWNFLLTNAMKFIFSTFRIMQEMGCWSTPTKGTQNMEILSSLNYNMDKIDRQMLKKF